MYYLGIVEIFMKETTVGEVVYPRVKDLEALGLMEIMRRCFISNCSFNNFKKYVSDEISDHLFPLALGRPYQARIYQFNTLHEISDYRKDLDRLENKIPVAFVQAIIPPDDLYYFKIKWD